MANDFLKVYPGWNVWGVWQVKDLSDTNPLWWGVSRDRRLRIWVEDALRLHGVDVADSVDLKGSQVEILPSIPSGLSTDKRKESVGDTALMLPAPAELRAVRFFNRGAEVPLPWPHDDEYLLDATYKPSPTNPATSGPPPGKVADNVTKPLAQAADTATIVLVGAAVLAGVVLVWKLRA